MNFEIKKVKIVVFVPTNNVDDVRKAACTSGAGIIGNYTYCTSSTHSTGTFIPNEKANPYLGEKNKLEVASEEKLEFICDVEKVKNVLTNIRKSHPYEEPEIDIIPLISEDYFN